MAEWDERNVASWVTAQVVVATTYGVVGVVALAILLGIGGGK